MAESPRQPIPQEPNYLPAAVDLLQYFGGTKTTGSTSATGDVSALKQVFGQQIDPKALELLVSNLFAQGASQVPALTGQFANATGARTARNAPLALSLAMLNQNLAQSIAQQIVQQQANASTTAGRIAENTRTTSSRQQTGPRPGASSAALAIPLAGFALNRLGKSKIFDTAEEASAPTIESAGSNIPFAAPGGDIAPNYFSAGPVEFSAPNINFATPDWASIGGGANVFDVGTGFESFAPEAYDYGFDVADAGSAFDYGSYTDFAPVEDVFDYFGGADFAFGFADGGKARRMNRGYADGGRTRGRPDFGQIPVPVRTPALTYSGIPAGGIPIPRATMSMPAPAPARKRGGSLESEGIDDSTGGAPASAASAPTSSSKTLGGFGPAQVASMANTMMAAAAAGVPQAGLAAAAVKGAVFGLFNTLFGPTQTQAFAQTPEQQQLAQTELDNFMSAMQGEMRGLALPEQTVPTETALDAPADTGLVDDISDIDIGDVGTPSDADAATSDNTADDSAADTGGDESASDTGDGGDSFADGGLVTREEKFVKNASKKSNSMGSPSVFENFMDSMFRSPIDRRGKDFGVPPAGAAKKAGVDTMSINVTPGEYVLPVDVVEVIGEDTLNDLIDMFHTPIKGGRYG